MLQIAVSPEPSTHFTALKASPLTTMSETAHGGAKPMLPQIRKGNQEFLEDTAEIFIVTIPTGVSEGNKFMAQTPNGERLLVTCPPGSKGGDKLRIPTPSRDLEDSLTKTFQITAPANVKPQQVLQVLVCGKRIPIKLPANVFPGQVLHLKLPVEQVVENIELSYEDKSSTTKGWTRTIRLTDLKFQWIYQAADAPGTLSWGQSAYCRKLTYMEGNDPRMRTGNLDLVAASEVCSESSLWHLRKTLISYATVADFQTRSWDEKLSWFQGICSELTAPWDSGRIRFVVRRGNLLADSVNAVMSLSRADMRKRWRIEILNEPAIDSGGVMREWYVFCEVDGGVAQELSYFLSIH